MIRLFLRWLELIGIEKERLTYRVAIHESADASEALRFWASVVDVREEAFQRTTLKRHNPKTVRKNVGNDYQGCLVVGVRRSTDLYRQIAGWWAGIVGRVSGVVQWQDTGLWIPEWRFDPSPPS